MSGNLAGSENVQAQKDTLQADQCSRPTVQEAHIDFLLEEEFNVDLNFLRRFIKAAGQHGTALHVARVERSVWDQWGEADLIVVYEDVDGKSVAILIEDKIRAGFQPSQSDRYRARGDSGKKWDRYWTCLVAPESYVKSKPDHGFDKVVTLEQIKRCLSVTEPKRLEFKVRAIHRAIETADITGLQVVDKVMTDFAVFEKFFPDQPNTNL